MVFKGVKVLVAGATGLIGSNLLKRLLEEGAQVRATLYHRDPVIEDPRIQYLRCDLRRPEDCARARSRECSIYTSARRVPPARL